MLARLGHYEEAVSAYQRALSLKPQLNAARVNLGLAHYRAGALPAALGEFKAAYTADPSLLQVRQLLGLVLVEPGRTLRRSRTSRPACRRRRRSRRCCSHLGACTRSATIHGRMHLPSGCGDAPDGRSLWQQLRGLVLQQDNRHDQALAAFEAAAALNDALPRIFVNIGVSQLALGDHAAARQAFETARKRSERDAAAHLYLAWLDEQDEHLPDAQRHAERAVALEDVAESRGLLDGS